jgi:hypothetical protein
MNRYFRFLILPILAFSSLVSAKTMDIYFVDADLGNCVMVVTPGQKAVLLDTGQVGEKYVNRILEVMKAAGVKELEYVIVSHYHWDHYGTVAELAKKVRIAHFVDHGPNVDLNRDAFHYEKYGGRTTDRQYDEYAATIDKGDHIVARPGDRYTIDDVKVDVVTSAGERIYEPLAGAPGAGKPNHAACEITRPRVDDESEDGQSVGRIVSYGKFRYADFGDLTWNKSMRLFCPINMVGTVDAYLISHHADSHEMKDADMWNWGRSSATPAEVFGLHPRVAFLSANEDYIGRTSDDSAAWQVTRHLPGMEDIWQTHYATQGGRENNAPEPFIANFHTVGDKGYYIKLSAEVDGSFSVTNTRNNFIKKYPARKNGGPR